MTNKEKKMAGVKKHNEQVKAQKANAVKKAINKLKKEGSFTLADLCEEAGVSRTYFSKNPDMRKLADKYITPTGYCKNRNKDSQETYIQLLKTENKNLNRELEKLKKDNETDNKYKEKYEEAQEEIKKLKEQLEVAYTTNLPDHL